MEKYRKIKIGKNYFEYSLKEQISPLGRPFRMSGISLNGDVKYINRKPCYSWTYTFKYLDEKGGFVSFMFDYNNQFVKMIEE